MSFASWSILFIFLMLWVSCSLWFLIESPSYSLTLYIFLILQSSQCWSWRWWWVDDWRDYCFGWVWWSLEFKGITATELPGRVCVGERERESARPAHLNPVPSNPSTQSQLTSCSLPGPNPHILQSSDIKCLSVLSRPQQIHSLFTYYASLHQHGVICSSHCCHVLGSER